jgi:hypothetical protein
MFIGALMVLIAAFVLYRGARERRPSASASR